MPPNGDKYEVIVLGTGITGLSTVYHLKQVGVQSIAIAGPDTSFAPTSSLTPGIIFGSPLDNFTRTSHRHGLSVARDLWNYSKAAYESLLLYCSQKGIPHITGPRLRLITSQNEANEAAQAVKQLRDSGIEAALQNGPEHCSSAVLTAQVDDTFSGVTDTQALLKKLSSSIAKVPRLPVIKEIATHTDGFIEALCHSGRKFRSEIIVLASHVEIPRLLPGLAPAIVATSDQWCKVQFTNAIPNDLRNLVFTLTHGHIWGAFHGTHAVRIGGAKYLRPLGGMEATEASVITKINIHLQEQLLANFVGLSDPQITKTEAALDIRPCDELPIIGPMFGDGRILVACGYMGTGLSLGFFAGKCLADLIANGHAQKLPRCLWPERFRSMES